MPITDLLNIPNVNKHFVFRTLSVETVSRSSYMSMVFDSLLSDKSIVILYDYLGKHTIYQKEVNTSNKSSLSPSYLLHEYNELMNSWN